MIQRTSKENAVTCFEKATPAVISMAVGACRKEEDARF
jgi:hypothetical protein